MNPPVDMNGNRFDVVVVGNVGIDTNVYLPGNEVDFSVEANFTHNLDTVGQAGGYASRGYARLGWRVAFIGSVGDDHNGRLVREELTADGIDTSALFTDPSGTARSVNLVYPDGRRRNFYDGRGHMHLQPNLEACRRVLAGARLAHFNIPNWARQLLPIAAELGLTIACDIQDVVSVNDPYRHDFQACADILFFSAVNYTEPTPLIEAYLDARPDQIVIAGMGAQGCALGSRDGIRFFPAFEMAMPVIDTNGAGDSLAAGFLTSYVLEGFSLHDSVLRGLIAARYACARRGSSPALITGGQLEHFFEGEHCRSSKGEET